MSNELNLEAYFNRINYTGRTDVSYETLYELHLAHALSVPFENLDIHNNKPISLDIESLYKKIVENKKGGYCYEMNSLFSFVLKKLGFQVTDLLARMTKDGVNYGGKSHQIILVELVGKKYLADVGCGVNGIVAPLLLEEGVEQQQFSYKYRIKIDEEYGYVLQFKVGDEDYKSLYSFIPDHRCYPMDFIMANHFSSTYPASLYATKKFCTIPTKEGRITLTDEHLKILNNGKLTETKVESAEEFNRLLKKYFPTLAQ